MILFSFRVVYESKFLVPAAPILPLVITRPNIGITSDREAKKRASIFQT